MDGVLVRWTVLAKARGGGKGVKCKERGRRPKPAGRAHHAACVIDARYMLIHGGFNGLRPISCAWVLDLGASIWTEVGVASARGGELANASHPSARSVTSRC